MAITQKEKFGHARRTDRKSSGATYTPEKLARAVARAILKKADLKTRPSVRILDPGCGDGTLSEAILSELPSELLGAVTLTCVDTDPDALAMARERLAISFPDITADFIEADFVSYALKCQDEDHQFDLIIANPPYVRIQALDTKVRQTIKNAFGLTGRTDLAFAFILAFTRLIAPGGQAGVITSNRILSTDAGKPVREGLLRASTVTEVWDLGDTQLFDAAVLPAVIFFGPAMEPTQLPGAATFTSIYEEQGACDFLAVQDICEDFATAMVKRAPNGRVFRQRRGTLETEGTWRLNSGDTAAWAEKVAFGTWKHFEDLGKISVGIKTTADKVFISSEWHDPRPELLRPLTTHHVAGRYRPATAPSHEVLYTHEMRGTKRTPVHLDQYPISAEYLEQHRDRLAGRRYVQDAGREWFEIWVPHSPSDWEDPKIVFRDIAEQPTFWLDASGAIVNGDCYWIKLREGLNSDLIWLLLAVGNSSMIETFYDITFNERLYAGRKRFMTRHVRQFPIPDPEHPGSRAAIIAARSLTQDTLSSERRQELEAEVNAQILRAFGLT